MRTARAEHVAERRGLDLAVGAAKADVERVGVLFDRKNGRPAFDENAEAVQVLGEDCLGLPLRQAALVLVRAADAAESAGGERNEAARVEACAAHADGSFEERREHARAREKLEPGGLNGGRAGLTVRREPASDDARHDAVAGKLAGSQEASRAPSDDKDLMPIGGIFGHHQFLSLARACMRRARQAKGPAQQGNRMNGFTRRL